MSDISNWVRRTGNSDRDDINKLLGLITPVAFQEPEDAALQERIVVTPATRRRTQTVLTDNFDITKAETKDTRDEEITFQMPSICESYPFVHTTNGSPTFPATSGSTKYGGGMVTDGVSDYISVAHITGSDMDFEHNQVFSMAFFIKTTASGVNEAAVWKGASFGGGGSGYGCFLAASNKMQFRLLSAGAFPNVITASTINDGLYHSIVATFSGNSNRSGMKIYLDGSLSNTGTATTIVDSIKNTDGLGIGATGTGGSPLPCTIAWVSIFKEELSATWASNFDAGHLDLSGGNLVTMIPFVGDESEAPEATSTFCVSS